MVHLCTPARVPPPRGCPVADGRGQLPGNSSGRLASGTVQPPSRGGHRELLGHGPQHRDQLTGHRPHHWRRVLPPCAQVAITCAPADRCLPTRVLDRRGALCPAAWQVPTHCRRGARGPGPCDQSPPGRGLPGLRAASRVSALTPRRCRRRQAHRRHEVSGVLAAGQVAAFGAGGDRHGHRHAPEGLARVHHRAKLSGGARFLACLVKPLAPGGVLGARSDLGVADAGRRRGGTDDRAAPAPGRRAPGGPTGRAALRPPPQRVQAHLGRLELVERLCTRAAQGPTGCVGARWDIDRRESPRAPQPRQVDRVTTVGVHAVTGRVGHAGGRDAPADLALVRQLARAPVAPGSRCLDAA